MPTQLVGREAEIEGLTGRLGDAREGRACFAAIEGDPGMGKTRLLRELSDRASDSGCLALHGRAAEFERELPFGLFVDALDSYLEATPPGTFSSLPQDLIDELASAFPALRPLASGAAEAPAPDDRVRIHRAIRELIGNLAPGKTTVITLDDLQWSDRASLEAVGHLLRRPPRSGLLLVFAYRTRRLDPAVMTEIRAASDGGDLDVVRLSALQKEAAATLVDLDAETFDDLYESSGGNPFYLTELARMESRPASFTGAVNGDVPEAISTAIGRELDGLSEGGRSLVHAASVAGDPFGLDLAMSAAGLDEAAGLDALDELVAADLVRPTTVPRRFSFRHPLVRAAIYEAVPHGTRLAIHSSCATLLRDGDELSVRAHHVEQAAQPGDMDAVAILRDAALESAARAPASAIRWLRAALRLLPADAEDSVRSELLLPLPGLLTSVSDFTGAYEATKEALATVSPEQGGVRVSLTIACASFEQALGQRDKASQRLDSAIASAAADPAERVSFLIAKLMDRFYAREFTGMPEWGAQAVEAAAEVDDPALLAAALGGHTMGCALAGEIAEAEKVRKKAVELIESLPDDVLAQRLDAIGGLSAAEMYMDHFADAVDHAERGLRVGRATGTASFAPTLVPVYGTCLWVLGETGRGVAALGEAVEVARIGRNDLALAWSLLNYSLAQSIHGDIDGALRTGTEASNLASGLGDNAISGWAGLALGVALRENGRYEESIRVFIDQMGGDGARQIPGGWRAHASMELTRAATAAGDVEAAERSVAAATDAAEQTGLPMAKSWAERARAELLLLNGEASEAGQAALAAADMAGSMGARLDRAGARELAGRALLASGSTEEAGAQFELAATEYDECGAHHHRDRVELELGKLGRRASRRSRAGAADSGIEALSGRELEVARLVVDRKTNPEIAAELFLSEKTIESHLRNVFRKLGASSRVEVARIIEREG